MKSSRGSILWVALAAVIAIGTITPRLRAGSSSHEGRFKLPFDAQLGTTALRTGNYTFSVDRSAGAYGVIVVYSEGRALGFVVPQTLDRYEAKGLNPQLLCIRHEGKVTVRGLRLPNVGTYYFRMPKELQTLMANQPRLIETVPVQVSGE